MKNNVKYLFCLTVLLFLGSSFVNTAISNGVPLKNERATVPYGGAFVLFAGKFGGEITQKEIENQTEIFVDGCARGARIFEVTLSITKSGQTSTLTATSKVLTAEMRIQLKGLKKGDAFEFQRTKAYLSGGNEVVNVRGERFKVV